MGSEQGTKCPVLEPPYIKLFIAFRDVIMRRSLGEKLLGKETPDIGGPVW
jgi:hypothetical protein